MGGKRAAESKIFLTFRVERKGRRRELKVRKIGEGAGGRGPRRPTRAHSHARQTHSAPPAGGEEKRDERGRMKVGKKDLTFRVERRKGTNEDERSYFQGGEEKGDEGGMGGWRSK